MRVRKECEDSLFNSMVDLLTDEVSEEGILECLAEIIWEDYQHLPEKMCNKIAEQFYWNNYDNAMEQVREMMEPTALQEAREDIVRETMRSL